MLDSIMAHKLQEVGRSKQTVPESSLRADTSVPRPAFARSLTGSEVHIIAEIKYSSPSHGPFADQRPPEEIAEDYVRGGAVAFSVLTDHEFFRGRPEYLRRLRRRFPDVPALRKDFILDPYQVTEAWAWGASAYLLIVACLDAKPLADLIEIGRERELDALVEVHDRRELEQAIDAGASIIGVNNRNLRTFQVDVATSFEVARALEGVSGFTLISESGIDQPSQIDELRDAGFDAFLIGTSLMESEDSAAALRGLRRQSHGEADR